MTRSVRRLTSHEAVLKAVELYDELGADQFLARHGFGRSYRYQLVHGGRDYDSKAVAGVAFGFQFPHLGPLRSTEFSGGTSGAAGVLGRLGFDIRTIATRPAAASPRTERAAVAAPRVALRASEQDVPAADEVEGPIRLVGCVKTKRSEPAPAQDLYISDLFKKRRAYVQSLGGRWFILSAQHGLVAPDDVLDPYDMALKEQAAQYRAHWGRQVVEALLERLGPLEGRQFEVHAGAAYVDALRQPLTAAGGRLLLPLAGLGQGQQLSWYLQRSAAAARGEPGLDCVEAAVAVLTDLQAARSPRGFPWGRGDLAAPGLYAWHVDDEGSRHLSSGLHVEVRSGLVYAGQAGATAWPSGSRRSSTLLSRIGSNHLRGRISASTWRLSLAAVLTDQLSLELVGGELTAPSKIRLTEWMSHHLRLTVHPVMDRDGLSVLEHAVLALLDPPLNLDGMSSTSVRASLSQLRAKIKQLRSDLVRGEGAL